MFVLFWIASKTAQEAPKRPQDPPWSAQRGPKRLQEAAKKAPGGSKKASRASKLHPRCPAKMPCRELTNGHAESSRAGGGVPPKGKAIDYLEPKQGKQEINI